MVKIKRIEEWNQADLNLANESFELFGHLRVSYVNQRWHYTVERWPQELCTTMTFPNEVYNFAEMQAEYLALAAYNEKQQCVGVAIYKHDVFDYLYLYDLKVIRSYRNKGVGAQLINAGLKLACDHGYGGVYTIAQDNNLAACLFYLKQGFEIGGLNTHEYYGTSQADKQNVYFYLTNKG